MALCRAPLRLRERDTRRRGRWEEVGHGRGREGRRGNRERKNEKKRRGKREGKGKRKKEGEREKIGREKVKGKKVEGEKGK